MLDLALGYCGAGDCLFHPAHIEKPGGADALEVLIDLGRGRGMEWWTGRQIYEWKILRHGVIASSVQSVTLHAPRPLVQASLLLLRPRSRPRP